MANSIVRILIKCFIIFIILLIMTFMRMGGVPSFLSMFLGLGAIVGVIRYKPVTNTSNDDPKLKK